MKRFTLQQLNHPLIKIKMKTLMRTLTLLSIIFAMALTSCEEGKNPLALPVKIDLNEITFNINPTNDVGHMEFTRTFVTSDLVKKLEDNGVNVDKLKSVEIEEVTFEIKNPGHMNFNPLENVEALIAAPGHVEISVAKITSIPNDGLRSIDLPITYTDDTRAYFEEPEFTFIAKGTTSAPITEIVTMVAKIKVKVESGNLGSVCCNSLLLPGIRWNLRGQISNLLHTHFKNLQQLNHPLN